MYLNKKKTQLPRTKIASSLHHALNSATTSQLPPRRTISEMNVSTEAQTTAPKRKAEVQKQYKRYKEMNARITTLLRRYREGIINKTKQKTVASATTLL